MVHVPTRLSDEREVPVRLGPSIKNVPDYGPSKMGRNPYTDPMQFELEREKVLNTTWLLAGRSEQVTGTGDWLSFESHGETVVITRQPDGELAAFHNVCHHRGPSFVTEWQGCGARALHVPVPRLDVRHDGQGERRARAGRLRPGAPRAICAPAGRRRRVGRLGLGQPRRAGRRPVAAGVDRRGDHAAISASTTWRT